MTVPVVEVRRLTKRFGEFTAVDSVDLEIQEGELFGLLGPNGAGKTTLLRMLIGLVSITSGEARVAGIDVERQPDVVRGAIGVVPQALTSDLDLTGYENLDIFARFFGVGRSARRARIEALLRRVALWERRDDLVKTYSGGMRRRLEIARGLIHRPRVLFLDEPTIGLDPQSRLVIWDLLRELRRGGGLTVSLTTHYMDEAEALCDRIAIVDRGRIVALGSPAELKALVPGSDTIELALPNRPDEAALAAMQALPGTRAVDTTAGGLRVRADHGGALLPRLIELLDARGIGVAAATMTRITLEDVFIHFTGRELREEAGHAAGMPQAGPARRFT